MIEPQVFERVRREFRGSGRIDDELYGLLRRIAFGLVRRRLLPVALSPGSDWGIAETEDAFHGWLAERLLRRNDLLAAFDHARGAGGFIRSLERSFRHHLENAADRGELDNLIRRTQRLLEDDDQFQRFVDARPAWWGLAHWEQPAPFQGSDKQLLGAAWSLGNLPLFRYGADVERASPILALETLRTFLAGLFERIDALLTIAHMATVYRLRFDLGDAPLLPLEEGRVEDIPEPEPPDRDTATLAAARIVEEMTPRQAEVFYRRSRNETLEVIAEALATSRGTVDNELRRLAPLIEKHTPSTAERELVLEIMVDVLSP